MNISWRPWTSGSSPRRRRRGTTPSRASRPLAGLGGGAAGALLLAAGLTLPGGAAAQEAQEVDAGEFRITGSGGAEATERFAIRREGDRWQSAARISPAGEDAPAASGIREFRLQLDSELRPTFFELVDRRAGEQGVVGVRAGNRIQLRSQSEEGERWKELLLDPGLVVMPEGVAHPYYFVVRILESGADGPLPVVAPEARERRSLTVESRTTVTVTVGGEDRSAVLRELRVDGEIHRVWTDSAGRLLRVEVPGRDWTAVRAAPPGGS